jgi:hypothetical protein
MSDFKQKKPMQNVIKEIGDSIDFDVANMEVGEPYFFLLNGRNVVVFKQEDQRLEFYWVPERFIL